MCIVHTSDFANLEIYKYGMVYSLETFKIDKRIVYLQSLKVLVVYVIPNRFYESPNLKN